MAKQWHRLIFCVRSLTLAPCLRALLCAPQRARAPIARKARTGAINASRHNAYAPATAHRACSGVTNGLARHRKQLAASRSRATTAAISVSKYQKERNRKSGEMEAEKRRKRIEKLVSRNGWRRRQHKTAWRKRRQSAA